MKARQRKPVPPASAAALADALGFLLQTPVLAALAAVLGMRCLAWLLPWPWDSLVQGVLWLALYKYALEAMAATAQGNERAPDVLAHVEDSVHRRHLWVQVGVLGLFAAVLVLAPQYEWLAALSAALVLPGVILALAVSQNLLGALNPVNWLVVAGKLGMAYPLIASAWFATMLLQFNGRALLADSGLGAGGLAGALFYLLSHAAVIVLFRWKGLALRAYAAQLGYVTEDSSRPVLQREREQLAVAREVASAKERSDPGQRADRLREAIRLGAAEPLQKEYRSALRAARRLVELDDHARVRCSELIALGQLKAAAALALEALQDNPQFSLPEADPLNRLLDHLEKLAQWRSASSLAMNYRKTHPKRRDSLPIAGRAAGILADQLDEREQAACLLDAALEQAVAAGGDAALAAMRQRLTHRLPLRSPRPDQAPAASRSS